MPIDLVAPTLRTKGNGNDNSTPDRVPNDKPTTSRLLFEHSDEVTTGNAVHLDVNVTQRGDDLKTAREEIDATAAELRRISAQSRRVVDQDDQYWVEMTDIDGNWFCIQ